MSRFVLARRSTAEHYRAAPFGAYFVLPRALVFCARPALWGFAVWGEPNAADIATLTALVARDIAPDVPSHTTVVDLRGLELGDPSAFQPLIDHTRAQRAACGARVTRLAVVRPTGLLGMTVAGYFQVIEVPYSVRVFDDFARAAAWVGGSDLSAALDELTSRARGVPAWLAQLRTWLEDHARDATIEDAARVLARSRRSLQRDLARSSSSFRRELTEARIRVAKHALVHSTVSVTQLAYDLGFPSGQHFSTAFRLQAGEPPSRWRERHRDAALHFPA